MSKAVYLQNVIDEMELQIEASQSYLNIKTGELCTLTSDEIDAVEDEDSLEEYPEWERELLIKAREIFNDDSTEWIELPSKFDIHEYSIMEEFSRSYHNSEISDELLNAIRGSGAFRYFRDTLDRHGIRDEWFSFKKQAVENIAEKWLQKNNISYLPGRPSQ